MKDNIRNWLTEQFGADEDLFKELYDQYSTDMKATAALLDGLLASEDLAALGEKGHAMKGMAIQMGDSEVADLCIVLQDSGRAGDRGGCAAVIPKVCAAVAAL